MHGSCIGSSKSGVDDASNNGTKNTVAQIISEGSGDSDGVNGNFYNNAELVKGTVAQNFVDPGVLGGTSGDV